MTDDLLQHVRDTVAAMPVAAVREDPDGTRAHCALLAGM